MEKKPKEISVVHFLNPSLKISRKKRQHKWKIMIIIIGLWLHLIIILSNCWTYLNPGDGDPPLPEQDCEIDCVICVEDNGRSVSESAVGLWGLDLSSSLSPKISGEDSLLASIWYKYALNKNNQLFEFMHKNVVNSTLSLSIAVSLPLSLFLCSSLSLSAFLHFARLFWNHTWSKNEHKSKNNVTNFNYFI